MKIQKLVIDEGVSTLQLKDFENYCSKKKIEILDLFFIKEKYQQIPDNEIIKHILTKETALFTNDCVFHNKVIRKKLVGFYISNNDNSITDKYLKDVILKPEKGNGSMKSELKEDYTVEKSEIHELILPSNQQQLKKLNVKRRRIRSYFEGQGNIARVSATVSLHNRKSDSIIGIRIKIASLSGIKSLDATENYILENINPEIGIIALCQTMFIVIKLMLQSVETEIYFDSERIASDYESNCKNEEYSAIFSLLQSQFTNLKICGVNKHKQIDNLRNKLIQLTNDKTTNELLDSDFEEIKIRLKQKLDILDA